MSKRVLPFVRVGSVDMDVSVVSLFEAAACWFDVHHTVPTVLWVNPHDLGDAELQLVLAPGTSVVRRLTPISDPCYLRGEWSVGTHLNRGFGSTGA